ncbi:MAG: TerB family tellurite resistance protein [Byssovorax sp.]
MKPSPTIRPLVAALRARFDSSDEGLNAVVDLAVLVALADGTIDEAEMAALAESIGTLVGGMLDPRMTRHVVRESRAKIEAVGVEARAKAIGASLAAHGAADDGVRLGLAIALASDGVSELERARVELVAVAAGVDPATFDAVSQSIAPGA